MTRQVRLPSSLMTHSPVVRVGWGFGVLFVSVITSTVQRWPYFALGRVGQGPDKTSAACSAAAAEHDTVNSMVALVPLVGLVTAVVFSAVSVLTLFLPAYKDTKKSSSFKADK